MHGACALMFAALAAGNAQAQSTILTFEDQFTGYETAGDLEPDYAGFSWGGSPGFVTSLIATSGGFHNGTVDHVSLVAYDGSVSFSRATAFNFTGAHIASAWYDGASVTVEGWRNGVLTHSSTLLASTTSGRFAFNFTNIDSISINGAGGVPIGSANGGESAHLVLDNIAVSEISPVPEPATVWMLLGGALSLLAVGRLRKARSA
ncbi:PEP-CTERM sorting domain-containing protein [Massilia sp. DJPM01]|uniref:PEP-CTERM sorting domain-containing protein n=1 Tax=Massilia sp. DJPM01 TaxID=3024404 RepID=UPI00259E1E39|nr:PEP-CTERM sorting domain-containing protein [Massilia sp. DJPM01]MDM5179207.1 PEP-CTERM sorting domain-containing protein [Massilia sp. DJPM01]